MRSQQFLLCHLLMLAGCSHLAQHNMLSRPNSPAVADVHNAQAAAPCSLALLNPLFAELSHALNTLRDSYPVDSFTRTNNLDPNSRPADLLRTAKDAADIAILSVDSLATALSYTVGLNAKSSNRSYAATDICSRVGIILKQEFIDFYSTLYSGDCNPEMLAKLATAHSVCALHIAYLSASFAYIAYNAANFLSPSSDIATAPYSARRAHTAANAANKAILATAIAAVAAHLTTALAAEGHAILHANRAAAEPDIEAAAAKAAAEATKAAEAVRNAADLAFQAGDNLKFQAGDHLTSALVLVAKAAADRANTAAAKANFIACTIAVNLHHGSSADHNAKKACAQAAHTAANHAKTVADDANAIATSTLKNAIARAYINRDTATLDFELAKAALATHLAKVASFNSSTSSA